MGEKVVPRKGVRIYVPLGGHQGRVGGREGGIGNFLQRKSHDVVPDLGRVIGAENLRPVDVHRHLTLGVADPHRRNERWRYAVEPCVDTVFCRARLAGHIGIGQCSGRTRAVLDSRAQCNYCLIGDLVRKDTLSLALPVDKLPLRCGRPPG